MGWLLLLSACQQHCGRYLWPFLLRQSDRLGLIAVRLAVCYLWLSTDLAVMNDQLANFPLAHSFAMGIEQCVALLPGVSRSGS